MNSLILICTVLISIAVFIEIARRRESHRASAENIGTKPLSQVYGADDIETILHHHSDDDCMSVHLTTAAPSKLGRQELLSLRPGAPLWLEYAEHTGIDRVKVYSGGYMIGSLLLTDAEEVIKIIKEQRVVGSYVAQNDCTEENLTNLRIVVFYESTAHANEEDNTTLNNMLDRAVATPYKIKVDLSGSTNLFQN